MSLMRLAFCFLLFTSAVYAKSVDLDSWVACHRTELDSLNSEAAKAKIRTFLKSQVTDKKFVFIGEPEHYIHEKWSYRELIMSVLFEMGYVNIINEMGRSDSKAVNKFFHNGNESELKKVCLYGVCDGEKLSVYGSEEIRYYKNLRQAALQANVQISQFGWDIDPYPEFSYPAIVAALSKAKQCPAVDVVLAGLQRKAGESKADQGERVFEAFTHFSRNKSQFRKCFSARAYDELYWDLRSLSDSLKITGQFFDSLTQLQKNPNDVQAKKNFYQIFLLREPTNFDRLQYIVNSLPESAKFIVIGQNNHISKYNAETLFSYMGIIDNQPMWRSLGEMVATNFAGQTYHIWLGVGEGGYGSFESPCNGKACPALPLSGTIEETFSKMSDSPWIVSLAQAPLPRLVSYSAQMTDKEQGNLKKAADAYFFIPKSTVMVR